ncbi:hypothetical protein AAC387_Pa07g3154 [Persea americana]
MRAQQPDLLCFAIQPWRSERSLLRQPPLVVCCKTKECPTSPNFGTATITISASYKPRAIEPAPFASATDPTKPRLLSSSAVQRTQTGMIPILLLFLCKGKTEPAVPGHLLRLRSAKAKFRTEKLS